MKLAESRTRAARVISEELAQYAEDLINDTDANPIDATELELWLDNNQFLYNQAIAYARNVTQRIMREQWDTVKAVEGFQRNQAVAVVRDYGTAEGGPGDYNPGINTRRLLAAEWLAGYVAEWALGNYS